MASGNTAPQNFRKALAALKDSTKVGMARVNSEYKDMDVAVVKATNHDEVLPKEKHVRTIFQSVSSSAPRSDVAYCIHALARRLSKTHSWTVALKTLIVLHRGLREVDATFQQELIGYDDSRGHLLNLAHFKDDSSPSAWENSSWIRCYSLYLEESLECFRVLKYDIQKDCSRSKVLDTPDLLEQLPRLQQLLFRLLECQPTGAAQHNFLIQFALSIVAAESVKLYVAITDGIVNLVDKFFEMQRHDAIRALEIYKKSGKQAEQLSEFFEICRNLNFGQAQKYAKIEKPPISFLAAMEDYVKEAPQTLVIEWKANDQDKLGNLPSITARETISEINHEPGEVRKCSEPSVPDTSDIIPVMDLLSLDDLSQKEPTLTDVNREITAPAEDQSNANQSSSWELALVSASSLPFAAITSTVGSGMDRMTFDTLYDAGLPKTNQNGSYQVAGVSSNPFEESYYPEYPSFFPANLEPNTDVQMLDMTQNEESLMQQQQQQQQYMLAGHDSTNPFGNPFLDQETSC